MIFLTGNFEKSWNTWFNNGQDIGNQGFSGNQSPLGNLKHMAPLVTI